MFGVDKVEVRNCKKCNKVFNHYAGYPLCFECKIIDEAEFMQAREYIKVNPGVTVDMVAKAMGFPFEQIMRYVREERLEVHEHSNALLLCEICGCNLKTGRFCLTCKEKVNNEVKRLENEALAKNNYNQKSDNKDVAKHNEKTEKGTSTIRFLKYYEEK